MQFSVKNARLLKHRITVLCTEWVNIIGDSMDFGQCFQAKLNWHICKQTENVHKYSSVFIPKYIGPFLHNSCFCTVILT